MAELPRTFSRAETFLKYAAITPLLLIIGNHLGNFLPYPLLSENRMGNQRRTLSLVLIYVLLVISFYGSIDYKIMFQDADPEQFPLYDFVFAGLAMVLLLMALRFTHTWMYAIFVALALLTAGVFYSAKKDSEQEIKEANKNGVTYEISSEAKKKLMIVRQLLWTLFAVVIIFYWMSWCFMNNHFTEFYNTDFPYMISVSNNNGGQTNQIWHAKTKDHFTFREFMTRPRAFDNPEAFNKATEFGWNDPRDVLGTYFLPGYKSNYAFTKSRYSSLANEHVNLLNTCKNQTFSKEMTDMNLLFVANQSNVVSTVKSKTPGDIWDGRNTASGVQTNEYFYYKDPFVDAGKSLVNAGKSVVNAGEWVRNTLACRFKWKTCKAPPATNACGEEGSVFLQQTRTSPLPETAGIEMSPTAPLVLNADVQGGSARSLRSDGTN